MNESQPLFPQNAYFTLFNGILRSGGENNNEPLSE